jgi:hypothetical protein
MWLDELDELKNILANIDTTTSAASSSVVKIKMKKNIKKVSK